MLVSQKGTSRTTIGVCQHESADGYCSDQGCLSCCWLYSCSICFEGLPELERAEHSGACSFMDLMKLLCFRLGLFRFVPIEQCCILSRLYRFDLRFLALGGLVFGWAKEMCYVIQSEHSFEGWNGDSHSHMHCSIRVTITTVVARE